MVYVYELKNAENQVEYVGISNNLKERFRQHTRKKPDGTSSNGLFYGRTDLSIYQVDSYLTRKEAMQAEALHKRLLGFEATESNGGKLCRKLNMNQAEEIKQLYKTGNYSQRKLAKQFNVWQNTITCILNNKSYQEV